LGSDEIISFFSIEVTLNSWLLLPD
jgi:hypothetical protein